MDIFQATRRKTDNSGLKIGKNIAAAAAVAAVLGTGGYSAWRLIDQKFVQMNDSVSELSHELASSRAEIVGLRMSQAVEVAQLKKEIGGLAENYIRLEGLHADLVGSAEQVKGELGEVRSKSDKALAELVVLKEDLSKINSFTGELARGLNGLVVVVNTNAAIVTSNALFTNQVAADLKEVTSDVKHNATTLNELLSRVATMDEWTRKSFEGFFKISGELSKISGELSKVTDMFVAVFVGNILEQKPDFVVKDRKRYACTLEQENPNNPIHKLTVAYDDISDPPSWGTGKSLKPGDVVVSFTENVADIADIKVPLSDMKPSDGEDFPSAVNESSRPPIRLEPWGDANNSFWASNKDVTSGELPSYLLSIAEVAKRICDAATVEPEPQGPDKGILTPYPIPEPPIPKG